MLTIPTFQCDNPACKKCCAPSSTVYHSKASIDRPKHAKQYLGCSSWPPLSNLSGFHSTTFLAERSSSYRWTKAQWEHRLQSNPSMRMEIMNAIAKEICALIDEWRHCVGAGDISRRNWRRAELVWERLRQTRHKLGMVFYLNPENKPSYYDSLMNADTDHVYAVRRNTQCLTYKHAEALSRANPTRVRIKNGCNFLKYEPTSPRWYSLPISARVLRAVPPQVAPRAHSSAAAAHPARAALPAAARPAAAPAAHPAMAAAHPAMAAAPAARAGVAWGANHAGSWASSMAEFRDSLGLGGSGRVAVHRNTHGSASAAAARGPALVRNVAAELRAGSARRRSPVGGRVRRRSAAASPPPAAAAVPAQPASAFVDLVAPQPAGAYLAASSSSNSAGGLYQEDADGVLTILDD